MRWPVVIKVIPLPRIFGWSDLSFVDRLKLLALLFQAGAGMAMTTFAGYAMFELAKLKATWPLFYIGAMALILVGIIVTGFAGLLITRTLEVQGPGGFVFKSQDAQAATAALEGIANAQSVQLSNEQNIRRDDAAHDDRVRAAADQQELRDRQSGEDDRSAGHADQQP